MGYHIPDSPRSSQSDGRATRQASAQTEMEAAPVRVGAARRRNAIVGALFVDAMGSPRSPAICLAQEERMALARLRELQHAQELAAHDRVTAAKPSNGGQSGASGQSSSGIP